MFALEIDFHDGVSAPETLLIRRPQAVIGAGDVAHVVIDGAASSFRDFLVTRRLGKTFSCQVIKDAPADSSTVLVDGVYDGEAVFGFGDVTVRLTSLDTDLLVGFDEPVDKAATRVLRAAMTRKTAVYPALMAMQSVPVFFSFQDGDGVFLGRSRRCGFRIDSPDILNEHAKISTSDSSFCVEPLEAGAIVSVNGVQIEEPTYLASGDKVLLGGSVEVLCLCSETDMTDVQTSGSPKATVASRPFPCILAKSSLVKPSRLNVGSKAIITVGRDPASDVWVGASHVSQKHLELIFSVGPGVEVKDTSTNGTFVDGARLARGEALPLPSRFIRVDLQGGIEIAVCFSEDDEHVFERQEPVDLDNTSIEQIPAIGASKEPDVYVPVSSWMSGQQHWQERGKGNGNQDLTQSSLTEEGDSGVEQIVGERPDDYMPTKASSDNRSQQAQELHSSSPFYPEDDVTRRSLDKLLGIVAAVVLFAVFSVFAVLFFK